jgi:hypothetical protein
MPGGTEECHESPQSGEQVSGPRFEASLQIKKPLGHNMQLDPIISHRNPARNLTLYLFTINFNIILISTHIYRLLVRRMGIIQTCTRKNPTKTIRLKKTSIGYPFWKIFSHTELTHFAGI